MLRQSRQESCQSKFPSCRRCLFMPSSCSRFVAEHVPVSVGGGTASTSRSAPAVLAHVGLGVAAVGAEGEELHQLARVVLVGGGLVLRFPESQMSIAGSLVTLRSSCSNEPSLVFRNSSFCSSISFCDRTARSTSRTSRCRRAPCARAEASRNRTMRSSHRGGRDRAHRTARWAAAIVRRRGADELLGAWPCQGDRTALRGPCGRGAPSPGPAWDRSPPATAAVPPGRRRTPR